MAQKKSTSVRSIRRSFAVLDRVAPRAGAAWAVKLWFRIPPGAKQEAGRTSGTPFSVDVGPARVVGESWGEGPAVYLVHGWGGRRSQLDAFVAPLVDSGYRVVSFDLPSHGESTPGWHGPRSSTFIEMADALEEVIEKFGRAHAVIAHSGGAEVLGFALRERRTVGRAVLIAPMASPRRYLDAFIKTLGIGPRVQARLPKAIEGHVGYSLEHFDLTLLDRQFQPPTTLVVHDETDRETSWQDGADVAATWRNARLVTTSGLGHRRILRDPSVVEAVVDYVREPIAARAATAA